MDSTDKDYLLEQAMISIASFSAASKMAKNKMAKLLSKKGVKDMTTEEVLKYLTDFMETESEKMFTLYESSLSLKKKFCRNVAYIELIPEAPFNPEDKNSTIEILRGMQDESKEMLFLIHVYDKKGVPKFITIDEFEKNYYEYWEIVLKKYFNYSKEQIKNFKKGLPA